MRASSGLPRPRAPDFSGNCDVRLTKLTDYALRLLMHLAQHPDRLCTISEVAQVHGISQAHLMKVTHQLGRHHWITTVRGKGGGIRLAHAPAEIRLGQVVRSMETDFDLVECFGSGQRCVLSGQCRLTGVLQGAMASFLASLESHTLADIVRPHAEAASAAPIAWSRPSRGAPANGLT